MIGINFKITDAGWRNNRTIAWFKYEILTDKKRFSIEETIEFPGGIADTYESEALLKALHLCLGISYYKAFFPPKIEHPYKITNEESRFWNAMYLNGLGEFIYKNKLNSNELAKFKAQKGKTGNRVNRVIFNKSALLGLGGGKDSIVAGELLKEIGIDLATFVLATGDTSGQTKSVSKVMEVKLSPIKRRIDKQIIAINKLPGSYNGHIPISAVFGLVGAMQATSNGDSYIVVANESSASLPQLKWGKSDINHQWSKSLEFEILLQNYLHNYVSKEMVYFSAIRQLSSVGVAKLFSNYTQYFEVFTSDNSLFKIQQNLREHPRWSKDSPKSLSSFILLAPWVDEPELLNIFGRNFLDLPELEELFLSLLGLSKEPILDCVGTPSELMYCIKILHKRNLFTKTALMNTALSYGLFDKTSTNIVEFIGSQHTIPKDIEQRLTITIEKRLY